MQRHPEYTRKRIAQLTDQLRALVWADARAIEDLTVAGPVNRIRFHQAIELERRPARRGEQLGPPWATYWFRARARVPQEWAGRRVDLYWKSHSEATLWRDGRPVQGLNHEPANLPVGATTRPEAPLCEPARGGEELDLWIEVACNVLFGQPEPAARSHEAVSPFVLERCDLAAFDAEAWDLYFDLEVLRQLEVSMDGAMERSSAGALLAGLNDVCNRIDLRDRATWTSARDLAVALRRPASEETLRLSAIGHAHIDCAWLWPVAETMRKCERTFSSQLSYMARYPEHRFAVSQAQQWAWMKERQPALWRDMLAQAKAGRFLPAGGTWVEPDCNIPCGESLVRQLLYGQRFFEREVGARCREMWQPDVFGYCGQLPQLMRGAGMTRFLTQKLSWNAFNRPQHHTFTWEGIDGSQVLAHFPPADTYNSECDVAELRRAARDYKDHDRSRDAYLLFGHGDGGGGPTPRMLELLRRAADQDGLPRTTIRSPDEFFTALEADINRVGHPGASTAAGEQGGGDWPVIVGELYFELHRGTYTSVGEVKRNNRHAEQMLHDVELLAACAHRLGVQPYPGEQIERLWKVVLLHQFHDILPGSSIGEVYADARREHAAVLAAGDELRERALAALAAGSDAAPVNTLGVPRAEVALRAGRAVWIEAPACGPGRIARPPDQVRLTRGDDRFVLENAHLRVEVGADGSIASLIERTSGREALAGPGGVLEIYRDEPVAWDAWDVDPFHLETRAGCPPASAASVVADGPLRAEIAFERSIGRASRARQIVRLDAGARRLEIELDVDWQESRQMLKVAFPVDVRAMDATYEVQYGSLQRPTHTNTTHDLARFEVPAHRWADLSEHGFGVAVLAHAKYGWSARGKTLRLSLLRAPEFPAPGIDRGRHPIRFAVMPHVGTWQDAGVVAEAARFDTPVVWGGGASASWFSVDHPALVIDTVKKAEDSDALIVRLYEAHGSRGTARLTTTLPVTSAHRTDLLEDRGEALPLTGGAVDIRFRPHEIITIALG